LYFCIKQTALIAQNQIAEVLIAQNIAWKAKDSGVSREILPSLKLLPNFALIITGIRRCGKSTLLLQLMKERTSDALFLNFEDPRLAGFEVDDFRRLDAVIQQQQAKVLFFDEIQMLPGWEFYVRQKLDEGFQIVVTGSNATLLSKELGTKLTGRHLSVELFPFSYAEFLALQNLTDSPKASERYLKDGGFPDFLKTSEAAILQQLLDDILLRDIAVRYGLRDVASLRQLAVYLISNIGKPVSATKLSKLFGISAVSTILEYFSHLEDAYLLQFVPKFSYSLQTQIRNPKKVYAIDLGLFTCNSIVFSEESGRRLENCVYLHYRRQGMEIFYYNEKKECDFIVMERGRIHAVVQVCFDLNADKLQREMDGLMDAMHFFNVSEGLIVTMHQTDLYNVKGKQVKVIPLNTLLLSKG
jgi:predicted AAA+ superfamily ATPase